MKERPRPQRVERRVLADLKPHPEQERHFGQMPPEKVEALAANIRRYGLQNKIEVLRDGTIIKGHERRRALLLLGEVEVEVIVRYDLDNASPGEVEREFIEDNKDRKQLSKLALVKATYRLFEIEKGKARGRLFAGEEEEARDRLGADLEMSGRNVDRYLQVARTPVEVQAAFEANQLTLTVAGRVATLKPKQQDEIAARLRAGEEAKAVVEAYFPTKTGGHKKPADALASLVRKLGEARADLAHRVDQVPPGMISRSRDELKKSVRLLRDLLDRAG